MARNLAERENVLCVGSWNMTGWTPGKAHIVATAVGADILAVQETHLAAFPLECAQGTARRIGLHLHHGHPVPATAGAIYGRSCGVGFLAKQGVAVSSVLPSGPAWRRLHAMGRLHAVQVAPRPGLPRGLLLLSVYAPLQTRSHGAQRDRFVELLLELSHHLDMQVPTLLMGDFNGSVDPPATSTVLLGPSGLSALFCRNCWARVLRGWMCTEPCWTPCLGHSGM